MNRKNLAPCHLPSVSVLLTSRFFASREDSLGTGFKPGVLVLVLALVDAWFDQDQVQDHDQDVRFGLRPSGGDVSSVIRQINSIRPQVRSSLVATGL
jgi:hypothetical protein